jgi:mRNA-degrading endonuclease RelE of RelBE toxin-antitoxin system
VGSKSKSSFRVDRFDDVIEVDLPNLPEHIRELYQPLVELLSIDPECGQLKRYPLQDCRAIEVFNDDYRLIYRIRSGSSKRQKWVEIITFSAHARDATDVYEIAKERLGRRTKADQRKKK